MKVKTNRVAIECGKYQKGSTLTSVGRRERKREWGCARAQDITSQLLTHTRKAALSLSTVIKLTLAIKWDVIKKKKKKHDGKRKRNEPVEACYRQVSSQHAGTCRKDAEQRRGLRLDPDTALLR